jgi:hypothetical protein
MHYIYRLDVSLSLIIIYFKLNFLSAGQSAEESAFAGAGHCCSLPWACHIQTKILEIQNLGNF